MKGREGVPAFFKKTEMGMGGRGPLLAKGEKETQISSGEKKNLGGNRIRDVKKGRGRSQQTHTNKRKRPGTLERWLLGA